jgi:hypothetical protein
MRGSTRNNLMIEECAKEAVVLLDHEVLAAQGQQERDPAPVGNRPHEGKAANIPEFPLSSTP